MPDRAPLVRAPFKIRTDLGRTVVGAFSCPLGVFPCEAGATIDEGWESRYLMGDDDFDDQYEYRILLSNERLGPAVRRFFEKLLPDECDALYEEASYDAWRESDAWRSVEVVPRERILQAWDTYGSFFVEDGRVGFGALGHEPQIEVFIEEHGAIFVACGLDLKDRVEALIEELGLSELTGLRGIDNYQHHHVDVLDVADDYDMTDVDIKFSIIESLAMEIVNPDEGTPAYVPTPFWIHVQLDLTFAREFEASGAGVSFGVTADDWADARKQVEESIQTRFPEALVMRTMQAFRMTREDIGEEIAPPPGVDVAERGIWYVSELDVWN